MVKQSTTCDSTPPGDDAVEQRSNNWNLLLAGIVILAGIAWMGIRVHGTFFHDDAYITLRYVQHWQAGNGPVWNDSERVEGYTSFLHLVTLHGLQATGIQPEVAARIVGLCSYLAIWILIALFCRNSKRNSQQNSSRMLILIATIPTSFSLIAWSLGGLETPLYTVLLMAATYLYTTLTSNSSNNRYLAVGVLLALCMLARPEAALFVAVSVLAGIVHFKSYKPSLLILLAVAAIYLPYFLWRWQYYGDVFPNTYYAKLGTPLSKRLRDGFYYFHTFIRSAPWLPLLAIFSWGVTLLKQPERRTAGWQYMTMISVVGTLYVIWTGGDHMPAYRFWVPLLPVYAWLLAHTWTPSTLGTDWKTWAAVPGILMLLSLSQFVSADQSMRNALRTDPAAAVGKQIGTYISDTFQPGSLIATNSAGAVAFFAPNMHFIDMLGLNDKVIAHRTNVPQRTHWQQFPGHSKGDGAYVLSRNPDYIILGPAEGTVADSTNANRTDLVWFLSDQELAENPKFLEAYELRRVRLPNRLTFSYYQRK